MRDGNTNHIVIRIIYHRHVDKSIKKTFIDS